MKIEPTKFLLMWDCNGLEYVYDIGDWERRQVWATLAGKELEYHEKPAPLGHLLMRARFNTHRNYEIWVIETMDITLDDIKMWFEVNPQGAADVVRERGNCLFSDRRHSKPVIV